MSANQILMIIMAIFFVIGGLDRCLGCRFGLGKEFERGIKLMGSVALCILGIGCIAPVLARWLAPVLTPVYQLVGADPAMFAGSLLSCDAGGYSMAAALTENEDVACFSGLIVASLVGGTISYTVPLACGIIGQENVKYLAGGVLSGMVLAPFGCVLGGLLAGLPLKMVLVNLIPVFLLAVVIILGLTFASSQTIFVFRIFSRLITAVITVGLILGGVEKMTGWTVLPGMNPITDGFQTVGSIAIVLGGAMPLIYCIEHGARRPLKKLGDLIGIDSLAVTAILASVASVIPMFTDYDRMNVRGKVVVAAFSATAANILGAHMGFAAAVNQDYVFPLIISKVITAVASVPVSLLFCRRLYAAELAEEAADCSKA